ncbi:unnamed protein product [Symbiodinium sp. CCMP2456]|nr:unnamed protein product [Symbiodinium sp. CCMP2456]
MGNKMCCQCNDGAEENVTAVVARGYEVDPDETLDSKRTVVTIVFQKPDGSNKEINFTMRPWGIDFTKAVPVTVKRVRANSHAASLGVQTDWVALKIVCGSDRQNSAKAPNVVHDLEKLAFKLPLHACC